MKNRFFLFLFSLVLSTSSLLAQNEGRIGSHDQIAKWDATTPANFSTAADGEAIAQSILELVGLKANFEIRQANIPNAAAVVYGGKRYLLYNPIFFQQLEKTTGTKWAAISVLAHEIAHHLNGHTLTGTGSQPEAELEADEFSGFVLRKMGANLDQAQAAMKTLATINASRTHPAQYDRLTAIEDGWNKADGQITGKPTIAKTKPPTRQSAPITLGSAPITASVQTSSIDQRNIIGDVTFNSDDASKYYVTSRLNLVRVKNNQPEVIAKLARLNSNRFPYVIYDESDTRLFVDAAGNIITEQAQPVGRVTAR